MTARLMEIPEAPKAIHRDALNAALEGLGIDIGPLLSISGNYRELRLEYVVTNEQGHKLRVGDAIATATVVVPVTHEPT